MMEEVHHSKSGGRIPPQNVSAEKSLLGALMLSDKYIPEIIMILKPADFYEKSHQLIYDAMVHLYDQKKPVDLLTLTSELKARKVLKDVGGAPYLTELSNFVQTASHAKAYAEMVREASVRRKLVEAGTTITEKAFEEGAKIDELVGEAERELYAVSNNVVRSDYIPMEELLADAFERIEELHKNKGALRGLKTGFTDLDKMTAGLQKGDLVIVGARPAMGKTSFAQNLAYNVAKINNRGVLFFSMEMGANEIIDRRTYPNCGCPRRDG